MGQTRLCRLGGSAAGPVTWTATARPGGTTPFQRGRVEVEATAAATDPSGTADATATVRLVRG